MREWLRGARSVSRQNLNAGRCILIVQQPVAGGFNTIFTHGSPCAMKPRDRIPDNPPGRIDQNLINRTALFAHLHTAFSSLAADENISPVMLDLGHFKKPVNKTYGRRRRRDHVRAADTIARLTGSHEVPERAPARNQPPRSSATPPGAVPEVVLA